VFHMPKGRTHGRQAQSDALRPLFLSPYAWLLAVRGVWNTKEPWFDSFLRKIILFSARKSMSVTSKSRIILISFRKTKFYELNFPPVK
jgi:hypothetical protein